MNSPDIISILKELEKIQDEFKKCQACDCADEALGRIKPCGHHCCKDCLNKSGLSCPKCKTFCAKKDIAWDNIVTQTKDILLNLQALLLEGLNNETPVGLDEFDSFDFSFVFQNKTYQVNFVDEQRVNAKGETPLHIACKKRKSNDVQNLINIPVDINAQDFAGWAPLHEAIESNSIEIIEMLLKNGALVDILGEEYTSPLHKAVTFKNLEIIELLLKYGANRDVIDYFGKKPIECIASDKEIEDLFNKEFEVVNKVIQLYSPKKVVAFCYYTDHEYKAKLRKKKVKIEETYNPKKVTHFILKKKHKISVTILRALLDGCTIVPQEWIEQYLKGDPFIHIPTYHFIDLPLLNAGIQKALLNELFKLPKLFDGMKFYIYGHNKEITVDQIKLSKDSLIAIIAAGGGKILHRAPSPSCCEETNNFPYHANETNRKCCHYIIFEEGDPPELQYKMPKLKHKSSKWVFDCAINFTILD